MSSLHPFFYFYFLLSLQRKSGASVFLSSLKASQNCIFIHIQYMYQQELINQYYALSLSRIIPAAKLLRNLLSGFIVNTIRLHDIVR